MDRPSWWPQHVARLTYMLTTRTAPIVRPRLDVLRAATGEPGAANRSFRVGDLRASVDPACSHQVTAETHPYGYA
jgi:hypothetical protein